MTLHKYGRGFDLDMASRVTPARQDTRKDALHRLKWYGGVEERSINTVNATPTWAARSVCVRWASARRR